MNLPDLVTREMFDDIRPLVEALAPEQLADQIRAAVEADAASFHLDEPWLVLVADGAEVFRMPVSERTIGHWRANGFAERR